jgi:hypothetical protein
MFVIERKWKRKNDQAPPCEGQYLYTVWEDDYRILKDLSEQKYRFWRENTIVEDWKK